MALRLRCMAMRPGGVINILTEDGPTTPFLETRLMGGSFGLQKYQAKTGGQAGKLNYMLNASYLSLAVFAITVGLKMSC